MLPFYPSEYFLKGFPCAFKDSWISENYFWSNRRLRWSPGIFDLCLDYGQVGAGSQILLFTNMYSLIKFSSVQLEKKDWRWLSDSAFWPQD